MLLQRNWVDITNNWVTGFRYRIPFYHVPFCIYLEADGGVVQTDIPVCIYIGSSLGDGEKRDTTLTRVFDEIGGNWERLAITTADGTTQCYVSVVEWDSINQVGQLWFKAPTIGKYDPIEGRRMPLKFYLYYDFDADDNTDYVGEPGDTPSNTVWSDFLWGFTFQQAPVDNVRTLVDFVATEQDGKWVGDVTGKHVDFTWQNLSGAIKKALDFEAGDTDYVTYATAGDFYPQDAMSLVVLQELETRGTDKRLLYYGSAAAADRIWVLGIDAAGHWFCEFYNNNAAIFTLTDSADDIGDGNELITVTYNGGSGAGDAEMFRAGGTSVTTDTPNGNAVGNPASTPSAPLIGTRQGGWGWWDGRVAFAAMLNIAVDKNWSAIMNRSLGDNLWVFMQTEEYTVDAYQSRLPIHVQPDDIDSDLGPFNLRIFLGTSVGADSEDVTAVFDELGNLARKVRITGSDGTTTLPCEIIYWDDVGEFAVLSVALDGIDDTNGAHVFLYFDAGMPNCGETVNTQDARATPAMGDEFCRLAWHPNKQKPNFPTVVPFASAFNIGWLGIDGDQALVNLDDDDMTVDSSLGPYIDITNTEWIEFADHNTLDRAIDRAFTLEVFVKLPDEITAQSRLMSKRDSLTPFQGYELQADHNADKFRIVLDIGAATSTVQTSTSNVDDDAWHHVVATYDGSDTIGGLLMYMDGVADRAVLTDNFPMGGTLANAKQLQIGARDDEQQTPTRFQIIEARYYTSDIGADRIKALNQNYRDGLCVFDPVESKTDFDGLGPVDLQYDDVAVKWVGYPTIFIEPTALNISYVPGSHTALTQAAHALINSATGARPGVLTASGGSPDIASAAGSKPKVATGAGASPGILSATGKVIP